MLSISQIPILKNIINLFDFKQLFTIEEEEELKLSIANLMDTFC